MDSVQIGLTVANLGITTIIAIYLARLGSHFERARWLRQERIESAVELKASVARIRSELSVTAREGGRKSWTKTHPDFAEVNTSIARCELTSPPAESKALTELRTVLRTFIRAAEDGSDNWRDRRDELDSKLNEILQSTKETLLDL